jgi:hypothetical protein
MVAVKVFLRSGGGFTTPYGMREFSPHQKRERKFPPHMKNLYHTGLSSLCVVKKHFREK